MIAIFAKGGVTSFLCEIFLLSVLWTYQCATVSSYGKKELSFKHQSQAMMHFRDGSLSFTLQ